MVAGRDLPGQVDQHDVVAAGLEFDGLAGGQVDARHLAHLHDVVLHGHFMHFHMLGRLGFHGHQSAWRGGRQAHERAGRVLAGDGGSHPGVFHRQGGVLGQGGVAESGQRAEGEDGGQGLERNLLHDDSCRAVAGQSTVRRSCAHSCALC
ncbi:hypothetical protein D3C87_1754190 [compost metagenome]